MRPQAHTSAIFYLAAPPTVPVLKPNLERILPMVRQKAVQQDSSRNRAFTLIANVVGEIAIYHQRSF
jgi:hypothetical protein